MAIRIPIAQQSLQTQGPAQFQATPTQPVTGIAGQQAMDLGEAMIKAGGAVSYVGMLRDDARTAEADTLMADRFRKRMMDPAQGFLGTVGKDANPERRKQTFEALNQDYEELTASLGNEEQKGAFHAQYQRRLEDANKQADHHEAEQTRVYASGEASAQVKSWIADTVPTAGTPDFKAGRIKAIDWANTYADLQGWAQDSAQRANLQKATTTELHGRVIDGMVASDQFGRAQQHLEQYKDDIGGEALQKMQRTVEIGQTEQAGVDLGRRLQAEHGNYLSQAEALEAMNTVREDGTREVDLGVYKAARNFIEKSAQDRRAGRAALETEMMADATKTIGAGRELTPQQKSELEAADLMWRVEAWREREHTTRWGNQALVSYPTPVLQAQFKTEDEVRNFFSLEMSDRDTEEMVSRWRGAWHATGQRMVAQQQQRVTDQQRQKDLFNVVFSDAAWIEFLLTEDANPNSTNPSDLSEEKNLELAMWKDDLRTQTDVVAANNPKMLPRDVIREAAKQLRGMPKVFVNGVPRTQAFLTPEQVDKATFAVRPPVAARMGLPPDAPYADMAGIDEAMLNEARAALLRPVPEGLGPDAALELQDIYEAAAEIAHGRADAKTKAENAAVTEADRNAQRRATSLAGQLMNDPEVAIAMQKEMRSFGQEMARPFEGAYIQAAPPSKDPKSAFFGYLDVGREQPADLPAARARAFGVVAAARFAADFKDIDPDLAARLFETEFLIETGQLAPGSRDYTLSGPPSFGPSDWEAAVKAAPPMQTKKEMQLEQRQTMTKDVRTKAQAKADANRKDNRSREQLEADLRKQAGGRPRYPLPRRGE